jgi:ribosomal protein L19
MRQSVLLLLVGLAGVLVLPIPWSSGEAFVGPAPRLAFPSQQVSSSIRLRASGNEVIDVVDEDEDDEFEDDEYEEDAYEEEDEGYPEEAYGDYAWNEDPPQSWFDRRMIDRHKVNMKFMDLFAKPRSFFPHQLQPGDTVRISFMESKDNKPQGDHARGNEPKATLERKNLKQTFLDGVVLNIKGSYHQRVLVLRTMVGKAEYAVGMEVTIPIHSPLVTKIGVLRRGYIARNKHAYFVRGMLGKKNIIPLDRERTAMDKLYQDLREDSRDDEIPEPEYPGRASDRYPLPTWMQDRDDWDEAEYAPERVDTRTNFQRHIFGSWRAGLRPQPTVERLLKKGVKPGSGAKKGR